MALTLPAYSSPALFTAFYNDVMPSLPGCQETFVLHHLRNAAIEFCSRSQALQVDLSTASIADTATYAITGTAQAEVAAILSVKYDGMLLAATSEDGLDATGIDWTVSTGTPAQYFRSSFRTLRLVPIPDVAGDTIAVKLAIRPTITATDLDPEFYAEYRPVIASGALAALMAMNAKPWTNLPLAAYHQGLFETGIAGARIDTIRSRTNKSTTVRPRAFGG